MNRREKIWDSMYPLIVVLGCMLAASVIVLLIAGNPKQSLKYLGCAAGGAALLMAVTVVMVRSVGIMAAVEAANSRLAVLISALESHLLVVLGIVAGVLLLVYVVFLILYTRKGKVPAGTAEA